MRFLVDEMLSRAVVVRLLAQGHFAERVSDIGLAGKGDHQLWNEAFRRDAIMITSNIEDFMNLARRSEIHAGLILLHVGDLLQHQQVAWVQAALGWIARNPNCDLVNCVLEVTGDSADDARCFPLPP